jgi:hypothetical protein
MKRNLEWYCKASKTELWKYLESQGFTLKDGYAFKDNDANVLAVAHLDVHEAVVRVQRVYQKQRNIVFSPALDDRLGIFILLELLDHLVMDILITDFEEVGKSTAQFFDTDKQYHWMLQFDRHGDDVVMYEYESDELTKALTDAGFKVGQGSYSDICWLNHLDCAGFNVGTGYFLEHTAHSFADMRIVNSQVGLFVDFFNQNVDQYFGYTPFAEFADDIYWESYVMPEGSYDYYPIDDNPFNDTPYWQRCDYCDTYHDSTNYDFDTDSYLCEFCLDFVRRMA